jgi:uncharacterized protein YbgA (DUF1722 family)
MYNLNMDKSFATLDFFDETAAKRFNITEAELFDFESRLKMTLLKLLEPTSAKLHEVIKKLEQSKQETMLMKQRFSETTELVYKRGDANKVERTLSHAITSTEKASETCFMVL